VKEPERAGDEPVDITPKEFGVRTVAQEYGGGAFWVYDDTVIFSNYKDQRLYKQSLNSKGMSGHAYALQKCSILSSLVDKSLMSVRFLFGCCLL